MTKPTEDSPPQGLNWNRPAPKSAEGDGDGQRKEAAADAPVPVKGVFDTSRLSEAPPPVGLKGVPPPIPEPPVEPDQKKAVEKAQSELAEMISDSLQKDSQPPLATFDVGEVAVASAKKPSQKAGEGNVRGVFGGDQPVARDAGEPAKADLPPIPPPPERAAVPGPKDEPGPEPPSPDLEQPALADGEASADRARSGDGEPIPVLIEEIPVEEGGADSEPPGTEALEVRQVSRESEPRLAVPESGALPRRGEKGGRPLLWSLLGLLAIAAGGAAAVLTGVVPLPLPSAAPSPQKEPEAEDEAEKAPGTEETASTGERAEPEAGPALVEPAPKSVTGQALPVNPEAGDDSTAAPFERDRDWKSLLSRAERLLKLGEERQAESLFRAVLEKEPDEHHAMKGLVEILLKRGAGQEALPLAERIVHRRSRRSSYRLLYGDALALTGDRARAEEQWKEALRLSPRNAAARRRLRHSSSGNEPGTAVPAGDGTGEDSAAE